jgi:starch synthase (maltosyl-transferring)
MRGRVVIENVGGEINCGQFAAKRVASEAMAAGADVFCDGHDSIAADLLYRHEGESEWQRAAMRPLGNDRWEGVFVPRKLGRYLYTIEAWIDRFGTWLKDLRKKQAAGVDIGVDLAIGAALIREAQSHAPRESAGIMGRLAGVIEKTRDAANAVLIAGTEELGSLMRLYLPRLYSVRYERELALSVDRVKALFSTWYEIFPRSWGQEAGQHGTLRDCIKILPDLKRMNFDVLYLAPIYPIGATKRRGKNNSPGAGGEDVGSPWAIGAAEGGHMAIHPDLGTMEDFEELARQARGHGIEVAMDLALQASPDHPYVKEHPEWFKWRPDGTIQCAENPPKVYEDIVPFNFETENWRGLWDEVRRIALFWIEKGVMIFRVDNPHTKPFAFWEWLIAEIRGKYPEAIFLAEAFTRPKVMYRLAKIGFGQSYTYFTWRNTKREITEYMTELTKTAVRDFLRPNFWPNTPDILPEVLQVGGRAAFVERVVLAATLSASYGIYGPAYELMAAGAVPGKEEYADSEKYEIKHWDWNRPGNLKEFITLLNRVRVENPALQQTANIEFVRIENEALIAYVKTSPDGDNVVLVIVNLDPFHTQAGVIELPLDRLGIEPDKPYMMLDLISDDKFIWHGSRNYVELNPYVLPAHIFRLHRRLKREQDFDYYI